jgi:hypothetical protein
VVLGCWDVGRDVGMDLDVRKEWGKVVKMKGGGMYLLQGGRRDEVSDEITVQFHSIRQSRITPPSQPDEKSHWSHVT